MPPVRHLNRLRGSGPGCFCVGAGSVPAHDLDLGVFGETASHRRRFPREVLHFSEDPTISRFAPHVAATAVEADAFVWGVDATNAMSYWFPRDCPRAMAWAVPTTTDDDRMAILGPGGGDRVHAVEYGWLPAMRSVQLYAYRFADVDFRPIGGPQPHAMVADREATPLGPAEAVGDLFELHERAGIQLRVLPNLWPFWDGVVGRTLGFSGIRLRNARPSPHGPDPEL